jgi:hypothetical protein
MNKWPGENMSRYMSIVDKKRNKKEEEGKITKRQNSKTAKESRDMT